jgi:sugar lactone lactonase YvrE
MRSLTRIVLSILFVVLSGWSGTAQVISTAAGTGMIGFSGDGGAAVMAQMNYPAGVAVDSAGNLFIADRQNHRVRKVTPNGLISTVVGTGTAGFRGDGGPAISAQLNLPGYLAVDAADNLFITDYGNQRIRKVSPDGVINTVAGSGSAGFSGDGGAATSARLNNPACTTVDSLGNLYIADAGNARVRRVTPGGIISTVAGNGSTGFTGDGGPATAARLSYPSGVSADAGGNLYIGDYGNHVVRKVTAGGAISTVVGTGAPGFSGDGGPALSAQLTYPTGVIADAGGNLYIADYGNHRIRKVVAGGAISTLAGNGTLGFNGDGGAAASAQLNSPIHITINTAGNLFIADMQNQRIRKVALEYSGRGFFPQVAVGGGYSTIFTVTNTGLNTATGYLVLSDPHGDPLLVNGTVTNASGITQSPQPGYSFPLEVPSGGTVFLSATGLMAGDHVKVGWAQLGSNGGTLTAVATYEYAVGSLTQTMVGVLQSQPLQYATIPVDNDASLGKQTAYAMANPGSQTIVVKLALVSQEGTVVDDSISVMLGPGEQIAKYLSEQLGRTTFRGSLVLRGQNGASFIAVPMLDKQGLLTAIPLISGKAPGLPN